MNNYIPIFILNEFIIFPGQEIKIDLSNETSIKVIKEASKNYNNKVIIISPLKEKEKISIKDFSSVGIVTKIKTKLLLSNGDMRVVLRGEERVLIEKYFQNKEDKILKCSFKSLEHDNINKSEEIAIKRKLITLTKEYIDKNKSASNSIINGLKEHLELSKMTDIIASFLPLKYSKKVLYMIEINSLIRANNLVNDLKEEINILNIDSEIEEKMEENIEKSQREFILKEKLKEINEELGNTKEEEINKLNNKLLSLKLNKDTESKLLNEISKYSYSSEYSPESAVIKNYLDTVLNLPWNTESKENLDINDIKLKLNETHEGLEEIKNRIIEYAALKKFKDNIKSPIICLVGPSGVGKTSIAISISNALNRKFYKMSVGGLNDSTELIGSRRTYLGSAPGKIIQGILKCKTKNPLILIDEVDKMVKDYKGDPASTLLEILDESQNKYFTDNYIEETFDLSKVMFILTANNIENIPYPLLDRLEIININPYTIEEKITIAKNYLLKNIFNELGINLKVNNDVIEYIITNYTKEAGVRELKRLLERLIRKICVYDPTSKSITITLANKYLESKIHNYLPKIRDYGISNTLAYTNLGGQLSHVEVSKYKGNGKLKITGCAGDILKESVNVVKSYILSNYEFELDNYDIHVHFMESALKKDGPSAGVSVCAAMLSDFKRIVIPSDIAFTGELSLKGDILPIGGLKEKLECSYKLGIKTVFIPLSNENDLKEISKNILDNLDIKLVSNFSEIYDVLFR